MSSSKLVIGCLAPLLGLAALYASWVALPPVHSAPEIQQALQHQQLAFETDQKEATDSSRNAFLDPQLSQFWGRKKLEYRDQSRPAQVASELRKFGFLSGQQSESVVDLWKRQDPALLKAVSDFEGLQPVLARALSRPLFIVPFSSPPNFDSDLGNLLAHRVIAQSLSAYVEIQLAAGQSDRALASCAEIFQLARLLLSQRSHNLMGLMLASAVQTTAQETLAYVLQSARLKPDQLRPWLEQLATTPLTEEVEIGCVEFELWVARNLFEHPPASVPIGKLAFFPGVWSREWRLYQNDYAPMLIAMLKHQPLPGLGSSSFGWGAWFLGRHSWLTAMVMPNYDRVLKTMEIVQKRQDFLRLYVRLLVERPSSLNHTWLGSLDPKSLVYQLENGEPHLSYSLAPALASLLPAPQAGPPAWQALMRPTWALPGAP
ncbi:hypothetical protein JST97_31810 [bacterium]|nr:hypothetical protein [bacterium]